MEYDIQHRASVIMHSFSRLFWNELSIYDILLFYKPSRVMIDCYLATLCVVIILQSVTQALTQNRSRNKDAQTLTMLSEMPMPPSYLS